MDSVRQSWNLLETRMTPQNKWLVALIIFLTTFLSVLGTFLIEHDKLFNNTEAWTHVAAIVVTAIGSMIAALKYQLPRITPKKDRVSDNKLADIRRTDE